jgi:hypothetical protein
MENQTGIAALMTAQSIAGSDLYRRTIQPVREPRQVQRVNAYDFFYSLDRPDWEFMIDNYMVYDRGFDPLTLRQFDVRLNLTSAYPVAWPIHEQGEFRGYQSRRVDAGEPKYLLSKGFSKRDVLAGDIHTGMVFLTEGWLDLMRSWEYGVQNVATPLNWDMSPVQIEKLEKYATRVICAFDNDEMGDKGYQLLRDKLTVPVHRYWFPVGINDICEFTCVEHFIVALNMTMENT